MEPQQSQLSLDDKDAKLQKRMAMWKRALELDCPTCVAKLARYTMPVCHSPSPRGYITYKPVPLGYERHVGPYVYGWPIRETDFGDLARKLGMKYVSKDLDLVGAWILSRLEQLAKLPFTLVRTWALPDEQAVADGFDYVSPWDDHLPGVRMMDVIVMSSTSNDRLYNRRPTLEQWKELTKWLGADARWFESVFPKYKFPTWAFRSEFSMSALYN
ncbi:hypothetical protein CC1G_08270 [Coprinopsis cinerea okayama7|uniref:Uncharacterized protein n=1 Tax=Coprinopsis cinerea (strain Okayama-7 / 130 / ATCC MYA-4618 / FGSC 9003) TaxID=240176 RepID=A8PG24_COPC7|nr:hypothetical protein CC1G_08270 [Coprinopsis cinerea okayama7\|eukprot:XP_001841126.2 hypothetical protein CC1G_08270 [Coprinopsis cinerea okayama7\